MLRLQWSNSASELIVVSLCTWASAWLMWILVLSKKLDSLVSTSKVVFTNCWTTLGVMELEVSMTIAKSRMRLSSRYYRGSMSGVSL